MEKNYIITNQTTIDARVISWIRSAFPQCEIDIIHWPGEKLENHPLLKDQSPDWNQGLIGEVKW